MTRYGDWSQKARQLTEETDRNGATYYKQAQEMIRQHYTMTHKEKLQAVEKKIREVCKELQELSEGCLIKIWWLDKPNRGEEDEIVQFTSRTMRDNGDVDGHYRSIIEDSMMGIVEVIGHPIHLEHVLRAIASEKFDLGMFVSFRDTTKLHMFPQGDSRKEEYIPMAGISVDTRQWLYNLSLPLADQSEPTIAFLYEVICNH